MYTAELKCSIKEPRASKAARVEKLLDDLNLQVRCDAGLTAFRFCTAERTLNMSRLAQVSCGSNAAGSSDLLGLARPHAASGQFLCHHWELHGHAQRSCAQTSQGAARSNIHY